VNRLQSRTLPRRARLWPALLVVAASFAPSTPIAAQNEDPLTPVPPRAVHRIPTEAHPDASPIPPEKIIELFSHREDEYQRAHQMYGFKRSVRVQEITAGGDKGGEIREDSEVYLADNGRRYERTTNQSSQRFLDMKSESVDAHAAAQIPLFPLTSAQMKYYDLVYKGTQPLDELHTYIFQVKPKRLLERARLFSGIVYVDDRDLAVVKIYGHWASQEDENDDSPGAQRTPFSMYEIYYENIDGKYWFPTYYRSDAYLKTKNGEDELRLIVKMTEFKVVAPVAVPGAESSGPPPSPPPQKP